MLPEVNTYDGSALTVHNSVHERVIFIVCLCDQKPTIFSYSKPDPPWEGSPDSGLLEGCFKPFKVRIILGDRF